MSKKNILNSLFFLLSYYGFSNSLPIDEKEKNYLDYFQNISSNPKFRFVSINEILPAPDANQAEFIELINSSKDTINLLGWKVSDKSKTVILPTYLLAPEKIVVLIKQNDNLKFPNLQNTLLLKTLPSLNNTGDELVLRNMEGEVMDSLAYSAKQVEKSKSLEQINPNVGCFFQQNWQLTTFNHSAGKLNEAYDLGYLPTLSLEYNETGTGSIDLLFNQTIETVAQLELNDSVIDFKMEQSHLILSNSILKSGNNILNFSGISTCAGVYERFSFEFIYDIQAPKLRFIKVQSESQVKLFFDEKVKFGENSSLRIENLNSDQFDFSVQDSTIEINFKKELLSKQKYQGKVSNLYDTKGNFEDRIDFQFTVNNVLGSIEIINPKLLRLHLNEQINTSQLNSQDFNFEPSIDVELVRSREKLQAIDLILQKEIKQNKTYTLLSKEVNSLESYYSYLASINFIDDTRHPKLQSVELIDEKHLKAVFDEEIEIPDLSETLCDDIQLIRSIFIDSENSLILTFVQPFENEKQYSFNLCGVRDKYGNTNEELQVDFYYDTEPPTLEEVRLISLDSIYLKFSEEIIISDSTMLKVENYKSRIERLDKHGSDLLLILESKLQKEDTLNFSVLNLSDKSGNIKDTISYSLDRRFVNLSEFFFINSQQLFFEFNYPLDSVWMAQESNYIIEKNTITSIKIINEKALILNLKQGIESDSTLSLKINEIRSANDLSKFDENIKLRFENKVEKIEYHGNGYFEIYYPYKVELRNVNLSQFMFGEITPNFLESVENKIILGFEDNFQIGDSLQLPFMYFSFGKTVPKSVHYLAFDYQRPVLDTIIQRGGRSLEFVFNEAVDFELKNIESELDLLDEIIKIKDRHFLLKLKKTDSLSEEFKFCVKGVLDKAKNLMKDTCLSLLIEKQQELAFHDLRFSEFRVNLSENLGIPNAQYIELYNTTEKPIDMTEMVFSDKVKFVNIPPYLLQPKDYVILCNESQKMIFKDFEKVIPIKSFPYFNKDSDILSLQTDDGKLIDAIEYNQNWFEKVTYGTALEIIDFKFNCDESKNWSESQSENGGTPSSLNSVKANISDNLPPEISLAFSKRDTLFLYFNENINHVPLENEFHIEPYLKVQGIIQDSILKNVLKVKFETFPIDSLTYQISLKGFSDCSGNLTDTKYHFQPLVTPKKAKISFNEILFEEKHDNTEFIEIYNPSNFGIDLQDLAIIKTKKDSVVAKPLISKPQIFKTKQFFSICENSEELIRNYPKHGKASTFLNNTTVFPLSNENGTLYLYDLRSKNIIDSLSYDADMHHPFLMDVEGVSLEKINDKEGSWKVDNWASASDNYFNASPSLSNSQSAKYYNNGSSFTLEYSSKIISPDNDGKNDYIRILYNLPDKDNFINIRIFNLSGIEIKVLAKDQRIVGSGEFLWNGTNEQNNLAPKGHYVVYTEIKQQNGHSYIKKEVISLIK